MNKKILPLLLVSAFAAFCSTSCANPGTSSSPASSQETSLGSSSSVAPSSSEAVPSSSNSSAAPSSSSAAPSSSSSSEVISSSSSSEEISSSSSSEIISSSSSSEVISSSEVQKHTITINQVEGATISISNSTTSIEVGAEVVVTVTITDEKAYFKAFVSEGIELTADSAISTDTVIVSSFAMPNNSVNISCTLGQKQNFAGFVDALNRGFSNYAIVGEESNLLIPGKTYNFSMSCSSYTSESEIQGYSFSINGDPVAVSLVGTDEKQITGSFVMPEEEARIFICSNTSTSESGFLVNYENNENYVILGLKPNAKYGYLNFSVWKKPGVKINSIKYTEKGSTEEKEASTYSSSNPYVLSCYVGNLTSDITLIVDSEFVGAKEVTVTENENITVSGLQQSYTVGDNVQLTYTLKENTHLASKGVTITTESGKEIDAKSNYGNLNFEMPNENVTVTFNVEINGKIIFEANSHVSNMVAKDSSYYDYGTTITSAAPGDSVYVFLTGIEDGFGVKGIKLNDGDLLTTNSDYNGNLYVYFRMPDSGDASIKVVTEAKYTVTCDTTVEGVSSFTSASYFEGDSVSCSINLESKLYNIVSVSIKDFPSVPVTVSGTYCTFTMPKGNVVLVPVVEKLETVTIAASMDDGISEVNISGSSSNNNYSLSTATAGEFISNEVVSCSVTMKSNSQTAVLKVSEGEVVTTIQPLENSESYMRLSFNFTMTANTTAISFVSVDKAVLTHSVVKGEDVSEEAVISYNVNGNDVTSIDSIYSYDVLKINVTGGNLAAGKIYKVQVFDANDVELSDNYGNGFTITSNFTIKITIISVSLITISTSSDLVSAYVNLSKENYQGIYNGDYVDPSTVIYSLNVSYSNYTDYPSLDIKITVGGEEVYNKSNTSSYGYISLYNINIVCSGDVVITVSPTVAA